MQLTKIVEEDGRIIIGEVVDDNTSAITLRVGPTDYTVPVLQVVSREEVCGDDEDML